MTIVANQTKRCSRCKETKLIAEFWKGQSRCIPCSKDAQKNCWDSRTPKKRLEQHLKYKYGIDPEQFLQTLAEQDHKCAICKDNLPDFLKYENRRRGYAIDHNHDTGEFRGVLCLHCNSLLGMAQDDIAVLLAAVEYLGVKGSYSSRGQSNG